MCTLTFRPRISARCHGAATDESTRMDARGRPRTRDPDGGAIRRFSRPRIVPSIPAGVATFASEKTGSRPPRVATRPFVATDDSSAFCRSEPLAEGRQSIATLSELEPQRYMIPYRLKTLACVAALTVTSCGGAAGTATHASANVEPQPGSVSSGGGGLGLRGDSVGSAIDPSKVKGRLPPEVIRNVVRDNFDGMKRCYEEGLGRDPALKGKIITKFVIERDGTVSTAAEIHDAPPTELPNLPANVAADAFLQRQHQAEEPRFPDPMVTACVVSKFKALKFPQPQGGIVTVVYPIIFQPEERER